MFRGRYVHNMDPKGRIAIPSRFRETLRSEANANLMIIPGPDSYLIVYPLSEWLKLEQKIAEKPQFNKKIEEFIRLFMSAGQVCPIDKQGRILIPLPFREYAHLTKEIVWIGMIKRMEIWAKEKWDQTIMNTTPQKLEELKNFIGELGL